MPNNWPVEVLDGIDPAVIQNAETQLEFADLIANILFNGGESAVNPELANALFITLQGTLPLIGKDITQLNQGDMSRFSDVFKNHFNLKARAKSKNNLATIANDYGQTIGELYNGGDY